MKSWKKKWKEELDLYASNLSDEVKNATIECEPQNNKKIPLTAKISNFIFNNKKPVFAGAFSLILVMILSLSLLFIPAKNLSTVLLVEVNPAIIFCTDKDGKVTTLVSANADGDVILCNETAVNSLIGRDLKTALTTYTDILNKLGYFVNNAGMRLSGYGNNKVLQNCKTASENYLIDHGLKVAVISQNSTEEELLKLSNLNDKGFNKISDLYEKDDLNAKLFINNLSQGQDEPNVENVYSQIIEEDFIVKTFANQLKSEKQQLIALLDEINQIVELNDLIKNHEDNPSLLNLSYWNVIDNPMYDPNEFSTEFKTLMQAMQQKLENYQITHGVEITEADLLLKPFNLNAFIEVIDFVTSDYVLENLNTICNFLNEINSNLNVISSLLDSPKDKTQYHQKLNNYYDTLKNDNANNYNNGAPVSKEEYNDFLNEIIQEYGSLENFWKNS